MTPQTIIYTIIGLLGIHWFADFFCQNDWMALNKSKRAEVLLVHVLVYTVVLFCGCCCLFQYKYSSDIPSAFWLFILINGASHFIIDALTSRLNSVLYENHRHWFFVNIGFDQFCHYLVLLLSLLLIIK